jgi:2-polyprenyl-3-methyl-5-hydroxy-6-metoxy-1,4-benzoquinol methylase
MKYAKDVTVAVLRYRAQGLGIFYDRRFDLQAESLDSNEHYQIKFDGISPHTLTFSKVKPGAKVVDMGCAAGYVGSWLQEHQQCDVVGVDQFTHPHQTQLKQFVRHHISEGLPSELDAQSIDYVLMLDVIEHLPSPERFVHKLAEQLSSSPQVELLVSTGNVAFIVMRLMLLFGQFNYGKRGILDITHTRLFTFSSLRHLFEQAGFEVVSEQGVPVPFGLVFKNKTLVKLLLWTNQAFIRLSKGLFSYQMYMTIKPKPGLERLLKNAQEYSAKLA